MVDTLLRLWPLDARHKAELLEQFTSVSRAVVVATLLAAVAQGVLAGVGFWFAGMRPVFLLMSLTMLLAMVPFVGAISVWVPCVAWIYFYEHRLGAAIGLAAYCTIVVSQIDNVIKPMVLHGRSNLHPLLALLSVLGGVTALGPIGIMVGPMAVAFLQTLLNMLHTELVSLDHGLAHVADRPPSGRRTAPHDALRPVVRRIRMMVGKWTTARRR
jgi:predicted PurR-regulated permease PerM